MNIKERHKAGWELVTTITPNAMHEAIKGSVKTLAYELVAASVVTYATGFMFADKIKKHKTKD